MRHMLPIRNLKEDCDNDKRQCARLTKSRAVIMTRNNVQDFKTIMQIKSKINMYIISKGFPKHSGL